MRGLLIVAIAGCTGVRPVAHHLHTTPLAGAVVAVPGETMEFRIALRGITVGLVQTAVGWPGDVDARQAVIVRSRGKTDGLLQLFGDLTWELTSTLDITRGLPLQDHEEAWAELAGEKNHEDHHRHWDDDDHVHDIHSAVCAVRAWRSQVGDRTEFDVEIGGAHLDVQMWHVGRAVVQHQPAIHYDGLVAGEFPISAWVSDDAARVPLRLVAQSKWGEISVELVDYQVPADH